nr:hypothetical protein [Tanacetum cinerariifolium]
FAIGLGGEEAVVEQPELLGFGIDIHAVDQANALDDGMGVARILAAYQLNTLAVALVKHRVVKQHVAARAAYKLAPHLLPELTRGKAAGLEKILHIIVLELGSDLQQLLSLLSRHQLSAPVAFRGDWQQLAEAASLLLARQLNGKAVLEPHLRVVVGTLAAREAGTAEATQVSKPAQRGGLKKLVVVAEIDCAAEAGGQREPQGKAEAAVHSQRCAELCEWPGTGRERTLGQQLGLARYALR